MGEVTGQEGCGPHPLAFCIPPPVLPPLVRLFLWPGKTWVPRPRLRRRDGWPFHAAPSFSPGPWLPTSHNEQLVENLHFMKIELKDKGVSLYYPVLPPWPIWVLSPP